MGGVICANTEDFGGVEDWGVEGWVEEEVGFVVRGGRGRGLGDDGLGESAEGREGRGPGLEEGFNCRWPR